MANEENNIQPSLDRLKLQDAICSLAAVYIEHMNTFKHVYEYKLIMEIHGETIIYLTVDAESPNPSEMANVQKY